MRESVGRAEHQPPAPHVCHIRVKDLDLSRNFLTDLVFDSSCADKLRMLKHVDVSNNCLFRFPNGMLECKQLICLSLEYNKIAVIRCPCNLCECNLAMLNLRRNCLIGIPSPILSLERLRVLDVRGNDFGEETASLVRCWQAAQDNRVGKCRIFLHEDTLPWIASTWASIVR